MHLSWQLIHTRWDERSEAHGDLPSVPKVVPRNSWGMKGGLCTKHFILVTPLNTLEREFLRIGVTAWRGGGWKSFVHSEQVLSLLSSLLSHIKWKCQQWIRAASFYRSFQRQCPLPVSLNPHPCWLFLFFTRSGHCCGEQLHSANTNTFSCPNPQNKDLFRSTLCSINCFTRLQLW